MIRGVMRAFLGSPPEEFKPNYFLSNMEALQERMRGTGFNIAQGEMTLRRNLEKLALCQDEKDSKQCKEKYDEVFNELKDKKIVDRVSGNMDTLQQRMRGTEFDIKKGRATLQNNRKALVGLQNKGVFDECKLKLNAIQTEMDALERPRNTTANPTGGGAGRPELDAYKSKLEDMISQDDYMDAYEESISLERDIETLPASIRESALGIYTKRKMELLGTILNRLQTEDEDWKVEGLQDGGQAPYSILRELDRYLERRLKERERDLRYR